MNAESRPTSRMVVLMVSWLGSTQAPNKAQQVRYSPPAATVAAKAFVGQMIGFRRLPYFTL